MSALNNIPMTNAERIILMKLETLERSIQELKEKQIEHSIEEISIGKAAKLLRVGQERLLNEVKSGRLKAITYRDSKRIKRYRFRVADIREYQNSRSTETVDETENPAESAREMFLKIRKQIVGK